MRRGLPRRWAPRLLLERVERGISNRHYRISEYTVLVWYSMVMTACRITFHRSWKGAFGVAPLIIIPQTQKSRTRATQSVWSAYRGGYSK